MSAALLLLAVLYGLCSRGARPSPPPPPALPPPPEIPPDPPITEMIDPDRTSYSPGWPQVVPRGLPPFPGSGWEHDDPPPPDVVARARALVSTLWARGQGSWRVEKTGGRWIAYRAEIVRSGKRGVVVYRVRAATAAQPSRPPVTQTTTPAAQLMPTLRQGSGMPPSAPVYHVRLVQEQLGVTPADGRFGAKTRAAVVAFQRGRGLSPDGIVGPKTWDALKMTRT